MAIGNHAPRQAHHTDWKGTVRIGLDEAFTSIEEALQNLTKENLWARPFPERYSIGTIMLHLLENLNRYACEAQSGQTAFVEPPSFDPTRFSETETATPEDLPDVDGLLAMLDTVRECAMAALESATENDLKGPRHLPERLIEDNRTAMDAYVRTLHHTMGHVRQIRFLRGALGLPDADGYPQQHWA